MIKVAILGAGKIGRAAYKIITDLREDALPGNPYYMIDAFVIDSSEQNISKLIYGSHYLMDLTSLGQEDIAKLLVKQKVTHVINALPFTLNVKIALASIAAKCSYIDFTEDDNTADKIQEIFKDSDLDCAVKCGLAPGFINYIGYDIINKIHAPDSLLISVGALPRTVSYDKFHPENSYNLTWSVDGLVNEYIRPCRIRKNGEEKEIAALGGLMKIILDGTEYEAAYTSGGIGSLVRDLTNVPNVQYMTLRYPGHYKYIREIVQTYHGNFDVIKDIFTKTFPFTDDDVIIVYANAQGKDENGIPIRRSYSNKFYGVNGLTGIQSTTASSGVAMLELMLEEKVEGIINHSTIKLEDFTNTKAFKKYYKTVR
jgi:saccharopine dehydrogenase-like NADP-dependent oxidoreductase